jgi:TPR repeat protein
MRNQSPLTQSFLGLDDKAFNAVPVLTEALVKALNEHKDAYHSSMRTVLATLAMTTGALILGDEEAEQLKAYFSKVLDAYVSNGREWKIASEFYARGEYATAAQLMRSLAGQGEARAQFYLGFLYDTGQGVPQDKREAVKWICEAANKGLASAQYAMGVHYAQGEGVLQDYVQAHMWFSLAADQGQASNPAASAIRDNIAATKMTPEQVAEAQRLATEWKVK